MDDKLKLKIETEDKLEIGKLKFEEAIANKTISEWIKQYLTFIDENTQLMLIKYYEDMYYNNELKGEKGEKN